MGNIDKGDTVKNFLKTLSDNNRLGILEGICEKFEVLMGASKGELEMVVQSASVSNPLLRVSGEEGFTFLHADQNLTCVIDRGWTRRLCSDLKAQWPSQSIARARS